MHMCAGGNGKQMFGDAWWLLLDGLPAVGKDVTASPPLVPPPTSQPPVVMDAPAGEQACPHSHLQLTQLQSLTIGFCMRCQARTNMGLAANLHSICWVERRYQQPQNGQVLPAISLRFRSLHTRAHIQHLRGELSVLVCCPTPVKVLASLAVLD